VDERPTLTTPAARPTTSVPVDESALRVRVREKIARGALPREPATRLWAGPGLGKPCAVCDETIPSRDVEYEIEHAVGVKLIVRHFHRRCYAVWELEREPG
jgi:hypothetical protein